MSDTWRTFVGTVQFDPTTREVNGKKVVNIAIRPTGVKDQSLKISATLWPSHESYFDQVKKGTVVAVEGKFDVRPGTDKDGQPTKYYNLSVTGIAVLGTLDPGVRVEADGGDDDSESDGNEAW
jgi:single-stranded DNA-binding protein